MYDYNLTIYSFDVPHPRVGKSRESTQAALRTSETLLLTHALE